MRGSWLLLPLLLLAGGASAQRAPTSEESGETRAAMQQALKEQRVAAARSRQLARDAAKARDAAARAAAQAAALAARVQLAEAGITAAEARIRLVDRERSDLREQLGAEQQPIVKLTAALQQFSRRPVALSLLRPGSISDVVYMRAVLDSAAPQIRARTAGLRQKLTRSRQLRREAEQALSALRGEEQRLRARRAELTALENRQQLASRSAGNAAQREAERALALAEEARDLDALVDRLDRAGSLRRQLATLPGPMLRPEGNDNFPEAVAPAIPVSVANGQAPGPYYLPVTGKTIAGFGARVGTRASKGITLLPRDGAQVVAPAAGRVVFAGPYRGYGQIVIIEHSGEWSSLVTGMERTSVQVGDELLIGAPLGKAGSAQPEVTLELRHKGEPVNPLQFVN